MGPLEETADMRRNPAVLHGRCRSYREQSREHLFYNEIVYALKIFGTAGRLNRYNVPQLALIFQVVYLAIKSVPRLHGVCGANRVI